MAPTIPLARDLGVPEMDLEAISAGEFDHFKDSRAALLRYVQAVAENEVDDTDHENLAEYIDDSTVVGTTLLVTHYLATTRFLDALDIPLEGSFVGWTPEEC